MEGLGLVPPSGAAWAERVDALFLAALGVTIFFSLLIATLIVVLGVRFRRRAPGEVGRRVRPSTALEIAWSVVPLSIMGGLFWWGADVYLAMQSPPPGAAEYHAVGQQWMWKFQHPTGQREINELHVPVGEPIRITMTSQDVIHSLFVPAFRIKQDVLPGRYTTLWFRATRPGRYRLHCAEYCGVEHSRMGGWLTVLEPDEYARWLAESGGPVGLAAGEGPMARLSCGTCHVPGDALRAPPLEGLLGRRVELSDGRTLVADEEYLRRSILDPAADVVAGYEPIMPSYRGLVDEEELLVLLRAVRELADDAAGR